jgi:hypothetical protein
MTGRVRLMDTARAVCLRIVAAARDWVASRGFET